MENNLKKRCTEVAELCLAIHRNFNTYNSHRGDTDPETVTANSKLANTLVLQLANLRDGLFTPAGSHEKKKSEVDFYIPDTGGWELQTLVQREDNLLATLATFEQFMSWLATSLELAVLVVANKNEEDLDRDLQIELTWVWQNAPVLLLRYYRLMNFGSSDDPRRFSSREGFDAASDLAFKDLVITKLRVLRKLMVQEKFTPIPMIGRVLQAPDTASRPATRRAG